MKIKKKFVYKEIELNIVEIEETYMNATRPMLMTRVVVPSNGNKIIPVSFSHKQTLKSMVQQTIDLLDSFEKRGCNVIEELNKK